MTGYSHAINRTVTSFKTANLTVSMVSVSQMLQTGRIFVSKELHTACDNPAQSDEVRKLLNSEITSDLLILKLICGNSQREICCENDNYFYVDYSVRKTVTG